MILLSDYMVTLGQVFAYGVSQTVQFFIRGSKNHSPAGLVSLGLTPAYSYQQVIIFLYLQTTNNVFLLVCD